MESRSQSDQIWDNRYFSLAKYVSGWSQNPQAQVGAVLVNDRNWPIALGYRGFSPDLKESTNKLRDSDLTNIVSVHSEQSVLLCAGPLARNGTIYVFGRPVCPRCAVLIVQAGVVRVVGIEPDPMANPDSESHRNGHISLRLFNQAGIEFISMDPAVATVEPAA